MKSPLKLMLLTAAAMMILGAQAQKAACADVVANGKVDIEGASRSCAPFFTHDHVYPRFIPDVRPASRRAAHVRVAPSPSPVRRPAENPGVVRQEGRVRQSGCARTRDLLSLA